jgi:uncharacterized cupredoxin-like copper-binding protein
MMITRRFRVLGLAALAVFALALVACEDDNDNGILNGDDTPPATTPTPAPTDDAADDANGAPAEPANGLFEEDAAETFSLTMVDIDFEPDEFSFAAGDVVEFDVTNDGAMLHDFTIDEIDADVDATGDASLVDHDADVHVELGPGGSGQFRLRVHESGTYEFYCAVPCHREAGMVGTLNVE